MPRVIAYGKEKGVGVWVYVNQHALMNRAALYLELGKDDLARIDYSV